MAGPESELGKVLAGLAPPAQEATKEQKEEKARFEKETIGGPTFFVNRHSIQTYVDGGVRMTFAEQYSGDLSVTATYRASIFMHTGNAVQFAQMLVNILPPGSITLPLVGPPIDAPVEKK